MCFQHQSTVSKQNQTKHQEAILKARKDIAADFLNSTDGYLYENEIGKRPI